MRRLRFLLRPGWIALVLAVFAFSGSCFLLLSPWQFGRNAGQVQQNNAIAASMKEAPAPLRQVLPTDREPAPSQLWRRVTITGRYLPAKEVVVRLRFDNGGPAYEVITPLRSSDGQLLLIDRGWIRPDNGRVPRYAAPPSGVVHVVARVQADENPDPQHRPPLYADGRTQVYQINGPRIGSLVGATFRPGYFQLVAKQPGVLNPIPLPDQSSGPFLSYALQWICFGVLALGGLGYFTRRELKPGGALSEEARRRRHEERAGSAPNEPRPKPLRGRRAVAAAIAEEEAREAEEDVGGAGPIDEERSATKAPR